MMLICGRGKDDYLTGVASQPPVEDPRFKLWKAENSIVMSWLINSTPNNIGGDFMLYEKTQNLGSSKGDLFR